MKKMHGQTTLKLINEVRNTQKRQCSLVLNAHTYRLSSYYRPICFLTSRTSPKSVAIIRQKKTAGIQYSLK